MAQLCGIGTIHHRQGGQDLCGATTQDVEHYGTVIGCGLYKKATEDTDPTAHLHRVGTPWYCHRAGTVAQL